MSKKIFNFNMHKKFIMETCEFQCIATFYLHVLVTTNRGSEFCMCRQLRTQMCRERNVMSSPNVQVPYNAISVFQT